MLKEDKCIDYVIGWKSKEVYFSKLTPLYTGFLHSIELSGYRIRIQFDNSVLVADQNNYATEIVNAYIVYDLNDWPKNPNRNLKLENCSFCATNIRKNNSKSKWVYTGYGIAFDGGSSWSTGNDFARNW